MKVDELTEIRGPAVPVRGTDIDTDRITPARFLKVTTFDGLGEVLFADDRDQVKQQGETHPLDDPRFTKARVLLVNENFGCGSSREHAPQAIRRWNEGIRAIVGESFAEIFFGNCVTIGIPAVTVDGASMAKLMQIAEEKPDTEFLVSLETMTVRAGDLEVPAQMPEGARKRLMEGRWDSTAELLSAKDAIRATAERLPYTTW